MSAVCKMIKILQTPYSSRSCHGGVAVLLPGFAISNYWEQNQVTRQPHAHDLPYLHFLRYFDQNFIEVVHQPWLWLCRMNRSFSTILFRLQCINTLRLRRNGPHFTNIFKSIFNENFQSLNKISLKYVPWGLIANMQTCLPYIGSTCNIHLRNV